VGAELNPLSELGQTLAAIANPWIMVDVYGVKRLGYFGRAQTICFRFSFWGYS
jgi:hypothetical protein